MEGCGWWVSTNTWWWYGGLSPPPAGPLLAAPRAADRAEHVASHDGGADAGVTLHQEVVVDAWRAALFAQHLPAVAGVEDPFVQARAAHPQRVVDVLVRPGGEPVERQREVVDS
jgi:hypothetical protein